MHAFVSHVLILPPYLANVIKTQLCSYFLKEAFFSSQPEHHILYHDKTVFQIFQIGLCFLSGQACVVLDSPTYDSTGPGV